MRTYRNAAARAGAVLGLALVLALGTAAPADAALVLRLTEGGTSVSIIDGGAGDANPVDGAVTFIGDVGAFVANVSTGLSKPVLGGGSFDEMDLNSVNVSTVGGTLVIELTDTDFFPRGSGTLTGLVSGAGGAAASFFGCKNESNVEFDIADCEASVFLGPFGSGAFAGDDSSGHGALGAYAMTLIATIVHTGSQTTSFDFELTNSVPEPATVALLGLGLLGAGIASRRRRRQSRMAA